MWNRNTGGCSARARLLCSMQGLYDRLGCCARGRGRAKLCRSTGGWWGRAGERAMGFTLNTARYKTGRRCVEARDSTGGWRGRASGSWVYTRVAGSPACSRLCWPLAFESGRELPIRTVGKVQPTYYQESRLLLVKLQPTCPPRVAACSRLAAPAAASRVPAARRSRAHPLRIPTGRAQAESRAPWPRARGGVGV